jgi:hypothetical protein
MTPKRRRTGRGGQAKERARKASPGIEQRHQDEAGQYLELKDKAPLTEAELFDLDDESRRLIIDHIVMLTGEVERQVKATGGVPKILQLPAPKTELEEEAMRMFLRQIEVASGLSRVNVTTGHGRA